MTDLPAGINLNNECPYVGANTAGCGAGTFEYNCPDPLGFAIAPEGGCVHPTSGADTTLRWCCTTALCSHFPTRDARCDCQSANRYDYNCAPGADRDRDLHRERERRLLLPLQLTIGAS